jgi:hypothetical protein
MQSHDDNHSAWTGDTWKAWTKYRASSIFETYTFNFDFGVGVIDTAVPDTAAKGPALQQAGTMSYGEMTYAFLNKNRVELLNLVD